MPRRARLAVAAVLAAAAAAAALAVVLPAGAAGAVSVHPSTPFRIDQSRIGRAPLGKPAAFYKKAYATPSRRYADDDGFDRLVFDDWHLAILFEPGRDAAVAVIT